MLVIKCPKCGQPEIVEVQEEVTVTMGVKGISSDGHIEYNGYNEMDGGHISRYECSNCKHVIPDITCTRKMEEYIAVNGVEEN
jgi:predicted RNA-binding Zn-ribbon protein involved in translation (DUF1610 family)